MKTNRHTKSKSELEISITIYKPQPTAHTIKYIIFQLNLFTIFILVGVGSSVVICIALSLIVGMVALVSGWIFSGHL